MRRIYLLILLLLLSACSGASGNLERPTQLIALATPAPTTSVANTPTIPARVNGFKTIAVHALPPEARDTLELIERGGPFPYRQDGQVFQNRERILPNKPSGYYHEYTVETPGSEDRGARRIVSGDKGELYYTDDHYNSFKVIWINE